MYKVSFLLLFIFFILGGCKTRIPVGYRFGASNYDSRVDSYFIAIPKGYRPVIVDLQHYDTKIFHYPDSSVIFISNSPEGGLVFDQLRKAYDSVGIEFYIKDTMTLSGMNSPHRYWKEKKYKDFLVGYYRVEPVKLKKYEDIINNVSIVNIKK